MNRWSAKDVTASPAPVILRRPAGLCAANVHLNSRIYFPMAVRSSSEPPLEWFAKVVTMQKTTQAYHSGPYTLPIVRYEDKLLFADLRLSEFRPVQGFFEPIPFSSLFGKELCALSGIKSCKHCNTNLILSAAMEQDSLRCPNCFNRL